MNHVERFRAEAKAAAKESEDELQMVSQILNISKKNFFLFLTSAYEYLQKNKDLIRASKEKDDEFWF